MSKVVSLAEHKIENSPHVSGPALCLGCGHKWQAVLPVPVPSVFDCPKCTLEKGVYRGLCAPPEDEDIIFKCNCGNERFLSQPGGMFCECCAVLHSWDTLSNA